METTRGLIMTTTGMAPVEEEEVTTTEEEAEEEAGVTADTEMTPTQGEGTFIIPSQLAIGLFYWRQEITC